MQRFSISPDLPSDRPQRLNCLRCLPAEPEPIQSVGQSFLMAHVRRAGVPTSELITLILRQGHGEARVPGDTFSLITYLGWWTTTRQMSLPLRPPRWCRLITMRGKASEPTVITPSQARILLAPHRRCILRATLLAESRALRTMLVLVV